VEIPEMAAVIRGIVRNSVEWKQNPYFDTLDPANINGLQMAKFDLARFYSQKQISTYVNKLKEERVEWLKRFKNLNPAILNALKP
jgi:phosphoenolpyruvate carboxykinase (ATP)